MRLWSWMLLIYCLGYCDANTLLNVLKSSLPIISASAASPAFGAGKPVAQRIESQTLRIVPSVRQSSGPSMASPDNKVADLKLYDQHNKLYELAEESSLSAPRRRPSSSSKRYSSYEPAPPPSYGYYEKPMYEKPVYYEKPPAYEKPPPMYEKQPIYSNSYGRMPDTYYTQGGGNGRKYDGKVSYEIKLYIPKYEQPAYQPKYEVAPPPPRGSYYGNMPSYEQQQQPPDYPPPPQYEEPRYPPPPPPPRYERKSEYDRQPKATLVQQPVVGYETRYKSQDSHHAPPAYESSAGSSSSYKRNGQYAQEPPPYEQRQTTYSAPSYEPSKGYQLEKKYSEERPPTKEYQAPNYAAYYNTPTYYYPAPQDRNYEQPAYQARDGGGNSYMSPPSAPAYPPYHTYQVYR